MRSAATSLAACLIAALCAVAIAPGGSRAGGPPGELLPVVATVEVSSLLGTEHVALTGWVEVVASGPRMEGEALVLDLSVERLHLVGASRLGIVTVEERPDAGDSYVSGGEVRSLQPGAQFPASSYLELFVDTSAPESPLGALTLHNETSLRLEPEGPVSAWPALGETYRLGPSADGCVPLLNEAGEPGDLSLCIAAMDLELAPLLPSFSVAPGGPLRLHPADVLGLTPPGADPDAGLPPYVRIACEALGLSADGCDSGEDGDQDDLDALSYGHDLSDAGAPVFDFSVGPGARGAPGSGVDGQWSCPPSEPGLAPEAEPDVFRTRLEGDNLLLLDGNGPVGACTPAFPLGFVEAATRRDDLDALDGRDPSFVDADGDGAPESPVYFSLAAGSPSLAALDFGPADILVTSTAGPPLRYASAGALGLGPGDNIDGLCLGESGDGVFGEGDSVYYSLAPGSPALAARGAGPGDLLSPEGAIVRGFALGLAGSDDVDALSCAALAPESAIGDVNCDGRVDSVDALLTLQYTSGRSGTLPCIGGADVDGNGGVDGVDATLILQYHAGLLERLPPPEAGGR